MKLVLCVMSGLALAACSDPKEAKFQTSCLTFASANLEEFQGDPAVGCKCLYDAASLVMTEDEVKFVGSVLDAFVEDEDKAESMVDGSTGEALEDKIQAAAELCGLG